MVRKGGSIGFQHKTFKTYSFALGPLSERFFIVGGPRGFRQKNFKKGNRYNYNSNPRGCTLISVLCKKVQNYRHLG
jgi:hypothetical protein